MKTVRIIPRLDIKGPNLVKGICLEGLRVMGKPNDFARYYYECGADELLYMDVVASLYGRNSLNDLISRTAKDIFIPLCVGGGIRSIDDIKSILRSGADKVCINSSAIKNPSFIKQASSVFGSSTIVVSIEAIKQKDGNYMAYIDNGREFTGKNVYDWALEVEQLGAGEIIITSVDNEGTGIGYDIELTRKVSEMVSIPVIAHGGAGNVEDILDVIVKGKVDSVSFASIIHYDFIKKNIDNKHEKSEGNITFLQSGRGFNKIIPSDIRGIKKKLTDNFVECRK